MHNKHKQQTGRTLRRPSERKPLADDQIKALLVAADVEWRGIILTGLNAGARLLDVANLHWSNIDMDSRKIHFDLAKSPWQIVVPMNTELHGYYASLTRPADLATPVFSTCFKYAQEGRGRLAARFRWFQGKAGLKPVGFLSLRKTFVHAMKTRCIPERLVAQFLGHFDWQNMPLPPSTIADAVAHLPRRLP